MEAPTEQMNIANDVSELIGNDAGFRVNLKQDQLVNAPGKDLLNCI